MKNPLTHDFSGIAAAETTSIDPARTAPSQPDLAAAVAKLNHLESLLFDGDSHVRPQHGPERAEHLLQAINQRRHQLGWLCLNMQHHYRWPDNISQSIPPR